MFYIHYTNCISAQNNLLEENMARIQEPVDKKLYAIEGSYESIPANVLRRMGKALRMAIGCALPLIRGNIDGIIIGSANAGMDDCVKFLNQIVQYDEGQLTPGNFVQSTSNVIAGQLGMITKNKGYNITHIHMGLAFENALIDANMQLNFKPANNYLIGGIDEISSYHYHIEDQAHFYKKENISNSQLYEVDSRGYIAGEGAAMFIANRDHKGAIATVLAIHTLHSKNVVLVKEQLQRFLSKSLPQHEQIDLLISGENGDSLSLPFYTACESIFNNNTPIIRYKHMVGEYPTASALGLWYACQCLQNQEIPDHMFKKKSTNNKYKYILLYNNFKGLQHSFILLSNI